MNNYPIKSENPYVVKIIPSKKRWGIYRRDNSHKIADFRSEIEAYSARRALIDFENDST